MCRPHGKEKTLEGNLITIDDVAKTAGVSKATVSRVINRPYLVNEQTACRVKKVMHELNFTPNWVAQSMRVCRTKMVGIIAPDALKLHYGTMLKAIEAELKKRDDMMLICLSSGNFEEERSDISRMLQRRVDGVLLFTDCNHKKRIESFQKMNVPVPFAMVIVERSAERGSPAPEELGGHGFDFAELPRPAVPPNHPNSGKAELFFATAADLFMKMVDHPGRTPRKKLISGFFPF